LGKKKMENVATFSVFLWKLPGIAGSIDTLFFALA
jgi:hypothetical protein